jgi:hypothetical protein
MDSADVGPSSLAGTNPMLLDEFVHSPVVIAAVDVFEQLTVLFEVHAKCTVQPPGIAMYIAGDTKICKPVSPGASAVFAVPSISMHN